MSGSLTNLSQINIEDHNGSTLGLELGGTLVTATAAELNKSGGATPGVAVASKVLVLGTTKNVDTMLINLLSAGAGGIETGLTAHAGGTQAAALVLSIAKMIHNITTVATAGDSVVLPAATGSGVIHIVKNSAATNALQLYAVSTSTIDGIATATGVPIMAGKARICIDFAVGTWLTLYTEDGVTVPAATINSVIVGLAAGYKIARSATPVAVTGTSDVTTGLATVIACFANAESDFDGDTLASVQAVNTGGAGHILLKAWKVTTGGAAGNPTMIAANAAKNISWLAIGT